MSEENYREHYDSSVVILAALVWKYGDVFIDDETEIETHIIEISYAEMIDFGSNILEVYNDDKNMKTYFRIRKTN